MSEEEINVAIARGLNLERLAPFKRYTRKGKEDPNGVVWYYCSEDHGGAKTYDKIPNYCGDLNAMHEVMGVFDYDQADEFDDHLCDICKRANDIADNPAPWRFAVTNATAIQRAEAFLRTLGKWRE